MAGPILWVSKNIEGIPAHKGKTRGLPNVDFDILRMGPLKAPYLLEISLPRRVLFQKTYKSIAAAKSAAQEFIAAVEVE